MRLNRLNRLNLRIVVVQPLQSGSLCAPAGSEVAEPRGNTPYQQLGNVSVFGGVMNANEKISGPQLANVLGVASRTISDLATRGILERCDATNYLLGPTIKAYCLHLRNSASGRGALSEGLSQQRERLTREQADREAAKNALLRGELLPAREVERAWATILRDLKANLLALPGRVQQRLGHLNAHDVGEIDREIRETLTTLGDDAL